MWPRPNPIVFPLDRLAGPVPAESPPGGAFQQPLRLVARDLDIRKDLIVVGYLDYVVARTAAKKRKWCVVQCVYSSPGAIIVAPSLSQPSVSNSNFGLIYLTSGQSVIFSETGDMPWLGPIYIAGADSGASGLVAITEAQEWPVE